MIADKRAAIINDNQCGYPGPDPWAYGLGAANCKTIETAVRYTYEQGLTSRPMTVDQMFVPDCM
jgi:4,5-dihydroxyphthalate decarboxylase